MRVREAELRQRQRIAAFSRLCRDFPTVPTDTVLRVLDSSAAVLPPAVRGRRRGQQAEDLTRRRLVAFADSAQRQGRTTRALLFG